jgi:anaerobic magnesium-protoporphyrin IX monomethyl ester cyclase
MKKALHQQYQKMLFVLPPSSHEGRKYCPSHHPIMTASLAGVARNAGAKVLVVDALITGQSRAEVVQEIQQMDVDWIGIMPFEYRRELPLESSLVLTRMLKEIGVDVPIGLLNCPMDRADVRQAVEQCVHFAFLGDSEAAVERFAVHGDFDVAGVMYNGGDGLVEKSLSQTADRPVMSVPAWDLFEHQSYIPSAHRYVERPVLPVMASRSCPFGCDFCPHTLYNTAESYSARAPQEVVAEIEILRRLYSVKNIEFYDPTFGINREKTLELCHRLQALENPMGWSCYSRCDLLNFELLSEMKKAGCHTILFGVESGNEDVLNRTGKEINLQDVVQMVQHCQQLDIQTIASFILGLPLDDVDSLQQTIHFACTLNPTFAQFHQARAFFAHPEWKELGRVMEDWEETSSSVNGLAYIPNGLTVEQLHWFLFKAYVRFYTRPQKIVSLLRQIQSPSDMKRYVLGGQQIAQHLMRLSSFAR